MTVRLLQGDCLDVLPTLQADSIDSIVTDPPYGLTTARPGGRSKATVGAVMKGFMGLAWDGSVPPVEVWAERLRALKPGGYLLAFAGARTYHRMACNIEDAGFEIRDQIMWIYGSGFPKSHNLGGDRKGWGTALKPAHEPIVLARKPLVGTVAENVRAHGTGALNIDGCRIGANETLRQGAGNIPCRHDPAVARGRGGDVSARGDNLGRWPANIIHDGSEEVLAAFPQAPGQMVRARDDGAMSSNDVYGKLRNVTHQPEPRGDAGSAARFFYCAKATKRDRDEGLYGFALAKTNDGRRVDADNAYQRGATLRANTHPTVKPTDLMRYLCRLVTPPGGIVLDPYMGSGSTGKAALREGLGFIGIEREQEYVEIAKARIHADAPLFAEVGTA